MPPWLFCVCGERGRCTNYKGGHAWRTSIAVVKFVVELVIEVIEGVVDLILSLFEALVNFLAGLFEGAFGIATGQSGSRAAQGQREHHKPSLDTGSGMNTRIG